ncbi:hypothetical protein Poly21_25480 [Allorhodopirellula heiligendammensis]|uniref:Uncharacterized protein n=1 Tax=Allorhodopirellula heiligendammensis TaxID=2714739 RepID=A0A5C6BSZ8_9BACT|nr:hypothetical protein Poly21_25480 [Allorhodopirellula heiligendammensis]
MICPAFYWLELRSGGRPSLLPQAATACSGWTCLGILTLALPALDSNESLPPNRTIHASSVIPWLGSRRRKGPRSSGGVGSGRRSPTPVSKMLSPMTSSPSSLGTQDFGYPRPLRRRIDAAGAKLAAGSSKRWRRPVGWGFSSNTLRPIGKYRTMRSYSVGSPVDRWGW